jgi:hypothetical protein
MPIRIKGIREVISESPKNPTNGVIKYIVTGNLFSPKAKNLEGRKEPYSSFPVFAIECAL